MEMTLEEKIKRVVAIVNEAITIQKTNPVFIPVSYFKPENLGFPTPRDVFRVLRENGAMKNLTSWWGYDLIEEDKKQRFVKTDADEPKNDDDFEVYEIEIDESRWVNIKKIGRKKEKTLLVINDLVFNESGRLHSRSNPNIKAQFGKDTARHKILNAIARASGLSVSTDELRTISGKRTNQNVRKEVGAIRRRIAKMLGIKNPKEEEIIAGEEYSGYRLVIKVKPI